MADSAAMSGRVRCMRAIFLRSGRNGKAEVPALGKWFSGSQSTPACYHGASRQGRSRHCDLRRRFKPIASGVSSLSSTVAIGHHPQALGSARFILSASELFTAPFALPCPPLEMKVVRGFAWAGQVDYLVTGNLSDYPSERRRECAVVSPAQFRETWRKGNR